MLLLSPGCPRIYIQGPLGGFQVLPILLRLYQSIICDSSTGEVLLAGDSAGGNLCLSLSFAASSAGLPLPHQLILFSPFVDISLSNPDIPRFLPNDPVLNVKVTQHHGLTWLRGEGDAKAASVDELRQVKVSPLYGDYSVFTPLHPRPAVTTQHESKHEGVSFKGTNIIVTTGLYDILHPDIELMVSKAERAGVKGTCIVNEHGIHAWSVMMGLMPEAAMGMEMVCQAVEEFSESDGTPSI